MSTKANARERRGQPSHREDLRGELLEAAVAYVVREGHESLSLRRLADMVGVAPSAPYHHFPDRRALLIAVALEGYKAMLALRGDKAA
ncbi:TetR/AcrR family transcriptional regulator, partial [Mycobacterium tuberculosis]